MQRCGIEMLAGLIAAGLVEGLVAGWAGGAPPAAPTHGQPPAPPAHLLTVAERTEYRQTARYEDVVRLLDDLAAAYPMAAREEMGKTFEARSIPMLVVADPPVKLVPGQTINKEDLGGRLVVLAFASIHAGEVDGKEALPILAREILSNPSSEENRLLLDNLVMVFAPIYNADGNERVTKGIRGGQNGPDETGIRENAQGFDLNRDFVKLEAPETRALVAAMRRWDPAVVVDCHITNGSYHRYIVTYAGAKVPAGDAGIIDYSRQTLFPAITSDFSKRAGLRSYWYGNFNGEFGPKAELHTRWETFPAEARYGTNYIGLRNRLSVLVETYTYAPFAERVKATVEFVRSTLRTTAKEKEKIREVLARADSEQASAARVGEQVAIRAREAPWDGKVWIAGFVEETEGGRIHPTSAPRDYEVELWDKFEPAATVSRPLAYLIPPSYPLAIENLKRHGIWVETTDREEELDVEVYRVESATSASRAFQGHVLVKAEVTPRKERRKIPAGWSRVRTTQTLGALAVYLLEPHSDDSLAAWNFFDSSMRAGEDYPVLRVVAVGL